jgi:hypothetical protein
MGGRGSLIVRCTLCSWSRTGRTPAMLAAQRGHRAKHASEGRRP